ncbi:ATP-binding cassette domain-containing protein [Streptomyces sp. MW-W600-10]|uniref:ATP-binding cassette domain-containing protein n=1 Tax=Streptomyces TaxID=1883 RepID=UPI001C470CDB|nr:ATP-binding cassette domain-containing protein [Streptomyces sp. MW-W600-10]MBV7246355.1 ATP-binding cassette domain-containing protein [Streptomyces sp. MW-W600-10]
MAEPEKPVLAMRGIEVRRHGRTRLAGLSLVLRPGGVVALTGESGAGKSTGLHVAAGLLRPTRGELLRTGRLVTVQFQDPRLLPWRTLSENALFALGRGPSARERARSAELLARMGLAEAADRRPAEVSGGMRRRAALVRALLPRPRLLIADEPFAHLDEAWGDEVEALLRETAHDGTAVLLAAHQEARAARLADEVVRVLPPPRGTRR